MRIRTSVQSDGQEELKQDETKPLASGLRRSSRLSNAPSDTTNDTSNSSGSGRAFVKKKGKGNGHPHHSKRSRSSVSEVSGPKSSPSKRRKSVQPIKWAQSGEDKHYAVKVPVKLEKDNKSSWDGEEDFDVESVLEKLVRRGHADEYLVKWLGWSFNQTTWLKREALDKTGERLSECRERFRVLTAASENAPKGFKLLPEKIDPRDAILPPGLQATYALELELKKHSEKTGAAPLYIMNWVDDEGPPSFVYIDEMMHSSKVCNELSKMYRLIKCDCSSGYCGGSQCLCTTLGNTMFKEGTTTLQGVNWISNSGGLSECSSACDCTNCKNKKTQAPRKVKLILTKSKEKGWGLLAGEKIPVGTFVTRYNGKLDSALAGSGDEEESDALRKELQKNVIKNFVPGDGHGLGHSTPSRLMWNGGNPQGLVIDAGVYGNESRFINHSCDPNLAVVRIMDQGIGFGYHAIGFFALEDIQVGEELTFDYGLAHEKGRAKCRCGKAVCRGALFPQRHLPGQPQSRNSRQSTSKKSK